MQLLSLAMLLAVCPTQAADHMLGPKTGYTSPLSGPALSESKSLQTEFAPADAAFKKRGVEAEAQKALTLYREIFNKHPENAESAWRLSAACYHFGYKFVAKSKEKQALFTEGRLAAEAGAKADPKCAACYFWSAINRALYGEAIGKVKMYFSLSDIKKDLNKSIELDPGYAAGGAYRLLGQIQMSVPGVIGGSKKEAKEYLEKAISLAPKDPLNYYWMAKLQQSNFKNQKKATELAMQGLALGEPAADQFESIDAYTKLKQFIEQGVPL